MEASAAEIIMKLWAPEFGGVTVGRIVQFNQQGQAIVDFPGNEVGPLRARSILDRDHLPYAAHAAEQLRVLLAFENCDPTLPIIIGCVHETLAGPAPAEQAVFSKEGPRELTIDGHRVTLEAREEIELRCGESSIILKKNGKIVVRGIDIVSRASRTNKVKGAIVAIN